MKNKLFILAAPTALLLASCGYNDPFYSTGGFVSTGGVFHGGGGFAGAGFVNHFGPGFAGVGSFVPVLPVGHTTVFLNNTPYFVYGNHFFVRRGGRFLCVDRPAGVLRYRDGRRFNRHIPPRRYGTGRQASTNSRLNPGINNQRTNRANTQRGMRGNPSRAFNGGPRQRANPRGANSRKTLASLNNRSNRARPTSPTARVPQNYQATPRRGMPSAQRQTITRSASPQMRQTPRRSAPAPRSAPARRSAPAPRSAPSRSYGGRSGGSYSRGGSRRSR